MIDLDAIRKRKDYGQFDGCHKADRDALLAYVDELRADRDALSDKASSLLITNYDLRKERDRLETTAGHLLDDALVRLHHPVYCPRSMGDYNCSCGLSKLKDRIKDWLKGLP